jgi:catechol 2,3-dioxygenase-like lactoylglutathione lyase family enzyme
MREQAVGMEAAFDGICELTLESRAPERMVEFYERLGLRRLSREGDRIVHDGGDRSLYLSDPEGNRLELWDYFDGHAGILG